MAASKQRTAAVSPSAFSRACDAAGVPHALGKTGVHSQYRDGVMAGVAVSHTHSADFDGSHRARYPQDNRWDYGLGIVSKGNELAFWVEAHPASSTGEVTVMLAKLRWLKELLRTSRYKELRDLTAKTVAADFHAYHWLAQTGTVSITPGSREARRLALEGLAAPRRRVVLA